MPDTAPAAPANALVQPCSNKGEVALLLQSVNQPGKKTKNLKYFPYPNRGSNFVC